jgi:small subunit ribosomal protein S6
VDSLRGLWLSARALPRLEELGAGHREELEEGSRMALYEHIYLARQDISAQQVDALTARFKAVIESFGGKVEKVEYWGVKSLAYRIKKNRKAHFSLLNIDGPPAALAELERQMGINEDVIRFMTVRVEALEQGQSAMMRKRDDDDRGDRHDRGDRGRGSRADRGERASKRQREEAATSDEAS